MWIIYIILCSDNSLYTGITNNLKKRFADHQAGKGARYTRSHKPVRIIYSEEVFSRAEALKREQEIKKYRREQKIRLLNLNLGT